MVRLYVLFLACFSLCQGWGYQGVPSLLESSRRSPVFLGGSLMQGARSNYVYRGRKLGDQVWESQVAFSGALSNDWAVSTEVDFLRGFAGIEFNQTIAYGELMYYVGNECTVGVSVARNWFDNTMLKSGSEHGLHLHWSPTPDWYIHSCVVYDYGQEGFYGQASASWQPLILESTAWVSTVSLGASSSYHGVSGLQDFMVRTGPLFRMGAAFRLQPFVAYYQGLAHGISNYASVGIWVTWCF